MRIAAVRHAVPSRRITNDDVIANLRARRSSEATARVEDFDTRVLQSLAMAGTDVRYALADNEHALDFAVQAGRDALAAAGMDPVDVDFLLYAGVGRGWIEPATAGVVQAELGLTNATGFDVMEACASWLRSLQVAHAYIRSGTYRRGMIVNAECGLYRAYADWQITPGELDYRLATYTIGEAATATIITDDIPADDFHFNLRTLGQHADLCMIPLGNVADFLPSPPTDRHVPLRFFACSTEIFDVALRNIVSTFQSDRTLQERKYDIAFGHDATARISEAVTRALGVLPIYFPTHHLYGNTVSASVPLAMSLAIESHRLKRGDQVLIIVGSAGMSIGLASFTF